jgi:hypothetical protein
MTSEETFSGETNFMNDTETDKILASVAEALKDETLFKSMQERFAARIEYEFRKSGNSFDGLTRISKSAARAILSEWRGK